MPYILDSDRGRILLKTATPQGWQKRIALEAISNAGELNYAITEMINFYFKASSGKYQDLNDIVGALEGAKAEFQRRVVAVYEDEKCTANGDVY